MSLSRAAPPGLLGRALTSLISVAVSCDAVDISLGYLYRSKGGKPRGARTRLSQHSSFRKAVTCWSETSLYVLWRAALVARDPWLLSETGRGTLLLSPVTSKRQCSAQSALRRRCWYSDGAARPAERRLPREGQLVPCPSSHGKDSLFHAQLPRRGTHGEAPGQSGGRGARAAVGAFRRLWCLAAVPCVWYRPPG